MAAIPALRSAERWSRSRYTQVFPVGNGGVLFSTRTGAVVELPKRTFRRVQSLFEVLGQGAPVPSGYGPLLEQLVEGGFLVEGGRDELAELEAAHFAARVASQFLLTILPTFACNLACDYCFVGKKTGMMGRDTQEHLIGFVTDRLAARKPPSMHVDWFGGEPLLALPIVQTLSQRLIALCDAYDIPYRAQVITNGTMLSREAADALISCHVDRVQVSVDGPQDVHDLRRPARSKARSSFADTFANLPNVIGRFIVRLRINVDDRNVGDVWKLFDELEARGWIGPATRFFPYLSRVSPFTEACARSGPFKSSLEEFWELQFAWMDRLKRLGVPVAAQGLYRFPAPKTYNCGAVGENGFVFTPEGEVHKCGLEVDDSTKAVGTVASGVDQHSGSLRRFRDWSPFQDPVCRGCEHLPTCLGGCPRDRIQGRDAEVKENCTYYKRIENQVLLYHLNRRGAPEAALPSVRKIVRLPVLNA